MAKKELCDICNGVLHTDEGGDDFVTVREQHGSKPRAVAHVACEQKNRSDSGGSQIGGRGGSWMSE
jgi:hypothetical protein